MKVLKFTILAVFVTTFFVAESQTVPDCGSVSDVDGNVYSTIVIGGKCWMRENLRTTHYSDGKNVLPNPQIPNGNNSETLRFGLLYTWFSVLNGSEPTEETDGRVQGVCPDGWHVPSNFEWMNLEDVVGYKDYLRCGEDVNNVAKALCAEEEWQSETDNAAECSVAQDVKTNNATGFSVLPAGNFWNGQYAGFGTEAGFWTCSNGSDETSPIHFFYSQNAKVEINCTPKDAFYSVRCVKND